MVALILACTTMYPFLTRAEIKAANQYHIEFQEGLDAHLADTAKYGEFLLLNELLKTFSVTLLPGQSLSFKNSVSLPIETRWGKYAAGGTANLTIDGKVTEGFGGVPVFEGTLEFIGDIVIVDGNRTTINKEEKHIETTATLRLSLFITDPNDSNQTREVQMHVGGLHAPAKTTTTNTTYYKDGKVSDSERTGSIFGQGFMFKYMATAVYSPETTPETKEDEITFTGRIVDFAGRPMKHMEVAIEVADKTLLSFTDENGAYSIATEELDELPPSYRILTTLRYKKDGNERFAIAFNGGSQGNFFVIAAKWVNVSGKQDLHCEYVLSSAHPTDGFTAIVRNEFLDTLTTSYHFMTQAVEFYEQELKLYDNYTIPPVIVNCYDDTQGGTLYYPGQWIYITRTNMPTSSPDAPHNREWHEYNHHVMYSIYGKWPQGLKDGLDINHGGYINDSTADSYVEGFAEFMSLVIADYYDLGSGGIYAPVANMDLYYKPWEYKGQAEELSVAAILWKLYQGIFAEEISSTLPKIWDVLRSYSGDFGEVYDKLIAAFPGSTGTIDSLFLSHGFFLSSVKGNGQYDQLEAYWDKNKSRAYDEGESFVDLPIQDGKISVRYEQGLKVGYAADAGRPERRSPLAPLGHAIKTNNAVPIYTVQYDFPSHPTFNYSLTTSNHQGVITVVVPPSDYPAVITVKPLGVSHSNTLSFTSEEFYTKYDQSIAKGSFVEHDFGVSQSINPPIIPTQVLNTEWKEPVINTAGARVQLTTVTPPSKPEPESPKTKPVMEQESSPKKGSALVLIVLGVGLVVAAVVFFILKKR